MRPKSRKFFTIAIICALSFEAEAVEALFDEHYDRLGQYYGKQPRDENAYINGRIGKHDVVLCYMPGMGKGSAASVASSLIISYPCVKLAIVVGICGGAPSAPTHGEIFLGDVIISDSVVEYDFGRQYPGGFQRRAGVKDTLGQQSREIRGILNALRAENTRSEFRDRTQQYFRLLRQKGDKWRHPGVDDILFDSYYVHRHSRSLSPTKCSCFRSRSSRHICEEALGKSCDELGCDRGQRMRCRKGSDTTMISIQLGPIASADTVMKSGRHRDRIVRSEKVIAFEMEGAGVWDKIPCIIIKGVCDYADSHKNKLWQAYAAATSASATKAFLQYWDPADHTEAGGNYHLMIPFTRNPHFAGRERQLQKLERWIFTQNGPKKIAITGLGGIGKTQIALELAYRIRDREQGCSIYWIPCTSYATVEQAFMTIAQMVGLQGVQPADVKERLKVHFNQTSTKWILICDNADEMDMWMKGNATAPPLKNMIPRSTMGHVIFTSRNRKLAVNLASPNVLSIPDVDENTAKMMLSNLIIQKHLLKDKYVVNRLLEQLAFLPLAISQATAYINQNDIAIETYMSLLGEQETSIIEMLSEEFEGHDHYAEVQSPVAKTWLISFLRIQQADSEASHYLSFMACISPRHIPESIFPPLTSAKRRVEALGLLKAYSFISEECDSGSFTIHRLVHLATRNWLREIGTLAIWVPIAAMHLDGLLSHTEGNRSQHWRDFLRHAQYLTRSAEFQARQNDYGFFLVKIAFYLLMDKKIVEAEIVFQNTLKITEKASEPKPILIIFIQFGLGVVLQSQQKFEEAEAMYQRNITMSTQTLGAQHLCTIFLIMGLSEAFRMQGKYEKAEPLHRQALESYKKVLGLDDSVTLFTMGSLGATLQSQGKYKEAEMLHRQVVRGWEKTSGPEDPQTICALYDLGSVLCDLGEDQKGQTIQRSVFRAINKVLDSEHPGSLIITDGLETILYEYGKSKEAEIVYRQILAKCKKVLEPKHPMTLAFIHNLGLTLASQGKFEEAEVIQRQALKIHKGVFGPEHPKTLSSMLGLAASLLGLGKFSDAEIVMKKCMELCNKVLGPGYTLTLTSLVYVFLHQVKVRLAQHEEDTPSI